MKSDDLIAYKQKMSKLNTDETILRTQYLSKLGKEKIGLLRDTMDIR